MAMPFPFWSIHLQTILIICVNLLCLQFQHFKAASALLGNETDYLALLKFQDSISTDPLQILSSWNTSIHFCNWHGITCGHKHQRVTELKLQGYGLRGVISPHVGNLSFLRNLELNDNNLYGEIPGRLQNMSLNGNALRGEIPTNLTMCTQLKHLDLSRNSLVSKIPIGLGSLRNLQYLNISINNLSGQIPSSMWNLSFLAVLSMGDNNLEGSIPKEIGQLKKLTFLSIASNKLSGMLPSSLYNMSYLTVLSLAYNQLEVTLPNNMFSTLPNLQIAALDGNQISCPIPTSISNASSLQKFDISNNYFVGKVPSLRNLKHLYWLNLQSNSLGSSSNNDLDFIQSLENCSELEAFSVQGNKFGGVLPNSISNLSIQLNFLYLGYNKIYGAIPSTLGRYTNLIALGLEENQFTGSIPDSLGMLQKIQLLGLQGNQISGEIPVSLGNLTQIFELRFSRNKLEGQIPHMFANWKYMVTLDLSENNLCGVIPLQALSTSPLSILLNLSHNSLNGTLPIEVGSFKNLGTLDISSNVLSGEIPGTIGECMSMEYLFLQGNLFSGTIPSSLASLKGLIKLDLSRNNLSGSIPIGLQNISVLENVNVSFNQLDGEVPIEGAFKNASAISVIGNNKLCGGISELHLPPCPIKVDRHSNEHQVKLIVLMILLGVCLLVSSFLAIWIRKRKRASSAASTIDQISKVSYQNLHSATEGFSTNNFIGSGGFGSVYKGMLKSEENVVAIKVLNLQKKGAHKSFISECNALKSIKHRNLVKILTCCSSIDYKGQEFKALVFEYMSNGSLEEWLHPCPECVYQSITMDLQQRFNILYDIASALHYLHYECVTPIVHCDLKPSNVLLDDDMVAHLSDFGLARLLSTFDCNSQKQTSTIGIQGTIGYAPPEYGISLDVSMEGDVYSFGILLLEMLTGRRPTEEIFRDGRNLRSFVKCAYPDNLLELVDSTLIPKQRQQTTSGQEIRMEEQFLIDPNEEKLILSLFGIGLACSMESPKERLNMMDVTRELNQMKNAFGFR